MITLSLTLTNTRTLTLTRASPRCVPEDARELARGLGPRCKAMARRGMHRWTPSTVCRSSAALLRMIKDASDLRGVGSCCSPGLGYPMSAKKDIVLVCVVSGAVVSDSVIVFGA